MKQMVQQWMQRVTSKNQWIQDSFLIGSVTLGLAGGASLFVPQATSTAFVGGASGTIGATIVAQQQARRLKRTLQVSQDTNQAINQANHQLVQLEEHLAQINHQIATTQSGIATLQTVLQTTLQQQLEHSQLQLHADSTPQAVVPKTIAPKKKSASPAAATEPPLFVNPEINLANSVQVVIEWLAARQAKVTHYYQSNSIVDSVFDQLAIYLGQHYTELADLYRLIKSNLGEGIKFNLQHKTTKEINLYRSFCQKLQEASFLSRYHYSSTDKALWITSQRKGEVMNFFSGDWFERFVYHEICHVLKAQGLSYQCLRNPKINFAAGDRAELDLCFIVEGQPLWIECKTGRNYDAYLERYSQHRKRLGITVSRALLVILDIPDEQAKTRTELWDMTVANQASLISLVETVLGGKD